MSIAKRLIALAALSTAAFAANAAIIPYTDIVDPTPNIVLNASGGTGTVKTYTFTHDITDDGYTAANFNLLSADLTVYLIDTANNGNETFTFKFGAGAFAESYDSDKYVANGASETSFPFSLKASLGDLAADGKLSVTLTATSGDFVFTHSELTAKAESVNVPEPASLALLGLGLGAIGLGRRRKS
jgi:hypothetical protein